MTSFQTFFYLLISFLVLNLGLKAQVISPNSQEVRFSYEAEFIAPNLGEAEEDMALDHSNYLFGVMHSAELTQTFRVNPRLISGVGSPRSERTIRILKSSYSGQRMRIRYSARGIMLLHNRVAESVLKAGVWELPLPFDPEKAYDRNCTDSHYTSFNDYWYFWNPFRSGCEHLKTNPLAQSVQIRIQPMRDRKLDQTPRLDILCANNGNGDLFSIYIVNGFAESSSDPLDEARVNYEKLTRTLLQQGFTQKNRRTTFRSPLKVFSKLMPLPNGKMMNVEIKSLLVETEIEAKTKTFATFFKEAVEQGDVIYFAGHSGLGGNLDIPSLEARVGNFVFPKNKRQIFFFDACSSYSYYLKPFAAEKTKARIDIVTNALSSYFHTGDLVLNSFLEVLLSSQISDLTWLEYLQRIERPLRGESYLMSVGGV